MKLLVLSPDSNNLVTYRLENIKAFAATGCEVVAAGDKKDGEFVKILDSIGVKYRCIDIKRNSLNPFSDLKAQRSIIKLIKEENPDKIFAYHAKTISYGGKAAKKLGISDFYIMFAGLGSVLRGGGTKNKLLSALLYHNYKKACKSAKKVFFHNHDDRDRLVNDGIVTKEKTEVLNGTGVNLSEFSPHPLPEKPVFLFVGRLLRDKGIYEYLQACEKIKAKYPKAECLIVGGADSNPTCIDKEELSRYTDSGVCEYCGHQKDIKPFLQRSSVLVLPSHHEGRPKSVLEAMACGRAIITTNAPGCRETIEHGKGGYLFDVGDVEALCGYMEQLINDTELVARMGAENIKKAAEVFDVKFTNQTLCGEMKLFGDT